MLPVGLYQGEKQKKKTEKKTAATTTSKAQQESTLIQGTDSYLWKQCMLFDANI